jgi:acetate kinase
MILVLNCGSQSIKYKVFEDDLSLVKEKKVEVKSQKDYPKILKKELNNCQSYQKEINLVGHRVVHGGEKFRQPLIVNSKILKELKQFNNLAPLHNPFNLLGVEQALAFFPRAKQIVVFDTAFFSSLPNKAVICPLSEALRKKYGFRKYGFHGISHEYAAQTAAKLIGKPWERLKIITCHLGGGASITAIKNGHAIDTSMGFTPLAGLLMMTRPGDIDPGIITKLCQDLSTKEVERILNKESGLKGICGFSDMRQVLSGVKAGNKKCRLALEVFVYQIQKYIGAYNTILGGCDALVFTGAIGTGSEKIRKLILKGLNTQRVLAVEANEELAIAQKIRKYV